MDSLKKEDPQKSSLAAETSGGNSEIENLPKRVDRYSKAKTRTRQMQVFLKGQDLYKDEYLKLKGCGNFLLFHHYYTVGKVRLHQACFCKKHLLCPLCAIRRSAKFIGRYADKTSFVMAENPALRASLITLTVKNGKRLGERYNHLLSCYRSLEKSRRNAKARGHNSEWGKVKGLVGVVEFTNKGNGWHPHLHIFALHEETIFKGSLVKQWKKITGDSMILDITPIAHPDEPERDLVEIFKYSLKFSDLSLEDNLKAYDVLSGKRLIFSSGILRGVKVPESLIDEPLSPADLPYIEMLYRFYESKGYQLVEEFKVPF